MIFGLGTGSSADQIFFPFAVEAVPHAAARLEGEAAQGAVRLGLEHHARLPRRAVALAHVARQACRGDVVPAVGAAPAAGQHMVDGKGIAARAAVLAAVIVTLKHVAAGEGHLSVGHPHELPQANHGGRVQVGPKQPMSVVLQPFGLAHQHHHHRPLPGGDVEGFVGGIENQNLAHGHSPFEPC